MFTMEPLSVQKVRDFFIRFKNATFFVKKILIIPKNP